MHRLSAVSLTRKAPPATVEGLHPTILRHGRRSDPRAADTAAQPQATSTDGALHRHAARILDHRAVGLNTLACRCQRAPISRRDRRTTDWLDRPLDLKSGSAPLGRQRLVGWSSCGRWACMKCQPVPRHRQRLLRQYGRVQVAVRLRRLYFGTGRWRDEILADWMTASGRECEAGSHRRTTASAAHLPVSNASRLQADVSRWNRRPTNGCNLQESAFKAVRSPCRRPPRPGPFTTIRRASRQNLNERGELGVGPAGKPTLRNGAAWH